MNGKEQIVDAIRAMSDFKGDSLTSKISYLERLAVGKDKSGISKVCTSFDINSNAYLSAKIIKNASRQIDVIIHTIGILRSLEHILEPDEVVENVSLGAGNTGKKFDLETNRRIAEYKFIDWQGGAESIRQNGIFKDFYNLAEYETDKVKILYVNGIKYPMKFFEGGRALTSVLSKQPETLKAIRQKYGENMLVVRDYFALYKADVQVEDISSILIP